MAVAVAAIAAAAEISVVALAAKEDAMVEAGNWGEGKAIILDR